MISFEYELTNFRQFLKDFALALDSPFDGEKLVFHPRIGKGYMRLIELQDGMEAIISDFYLKEDILLERKKDEREYYTFISEELTRVKEFTVKIGSDISSFSDGQRAAQYLTSFLYGVTYYISQGTGIRGIRVLLSPGWMHHNLDIAANKDVLLRYLGLKTAGLMYRKMDIESRTIIQELVESESEEKPLIFYQSRILKLIEKFCFWLKKEMVMVPEARDFSREDINRLMAAEQELLRDFSTPAPTIAALSRKAAMSPSKFKKIFKTIYGAPVYSYFQEHRMEKARLLLMSGNYTVSEVGHAVGYANLSNFSAAFKRKFNQLPSSL